MSNVGLGARRWSRRLLAVPPLLLTISSPAAADEGETEAESDGDALRAGASRVYPGEYVDWTDPCPDGDWENPTSGIGASFNTTNEEGEETNTAIVVEADTVSVGPINIPVPDVTIDSGNPASDATGVGVVDETIEFDGEEYTIWTNDYCPWGREVSFVPASAVQLLPDFQGVSEELLSEPELTLNPFDTDYDWTYVNVPIDFRTTPESVAPVTVTVDSGGPDPV